MASANIKTWAEVAGLGSDKVMAVNATDTTPIAVYNGYSFVSAVPTDDPIQIDLGTISPAALRCMVVKADVGTVYMSPVSSANVTAACVMTAGGPAMTFMFATNTALVWAIAAATTDAVEYMCYGVST